MKNTRENQCIETIKDALNSYIQNGDSVRFHNFVRRITRYELTGKPAIDAGTDAREYSSMKLYFGTKSGFEVVIDTYFGTVSAGDDRVWLADAVVDELNKIGELFYSYSDDEVKEDAYSEDRSVEPRRRQLLGRRQRRVRQPLRRRCQGGMGRQETQLPRR